jgi:exonuclease V
MASPAFDNIDLASQAEDESDYGSEFSPEEEEIVNRLLLSSTEPAQLEEDNPIITDVEYYGPTQAVRVPRVLGRERRLEALQEGKAVSRDAEIPHETVDIEDTNGELLSRFHV